MSTWTIETVRRETVGRWDGSEERGVYALVIFEGGESLHLSRLDGNEGWVADAHFGANGYPYWCHGFGSRCTYLQVVNDDDLVAALDAAAEGLEAAAIADVVEWDETQCSGAFDGFTVVSDADPGL